MSIVHPGQNVGKGFDDTLFVRIHICFSTASFQKWMWDLNSNNTRVIPIN